mgnify:CR=1 FL=1
MESKIFAKMNFDPGILVIITCILTVVMVILLVMLFLKQSRLEMNYRIFMRGRTAGSLEETLKARLEDLDTVKEQTEILHKRLLYVEKSFNKSLQKCGIVKYDAFKEIGGQLSFAFALLNDSNTGFVMNCIHSREGSYTYIKDIVRGECQLPLCDEEIEAIERAIESTTIQAQAAKNGRNDDNKKSGNPLDTIKDMIPENLNIQDKIKETLGSASPTKEKKNNKKNE